MKKVIIFIQLLLLVFNASAKDPEKVIACHFNQVPFIVFCSAVYRETGVKVYYQEKWVNNIKVTIDADSITVFQAVAMAVENSGLKVSIWNNDLVLLPGEKLITQLPSFDNNILTTDTARVKAKSLTASEERYITSRKTDVIQTIRIGKPGVVKNNIKARVLGRVLDQETGEPVFCATLFIAETKSGASTDINGFFSIMLYPGKYNAVFEFLGYEKKKYLLEVISDGDFTLNMKKKVIQMKEFVMYGDSKLSIKSRDPGFEKISMKSIKELPMMMGERDIMKISGMLPGIVSTGEGSSGLNVRGGGSDQNAFYIDKIPIYNTSHLFGFFSAFNADIIKDFSIYKGHIPAQYGGRLSSVFNIITRQGNRKHFTAHGGISPISGNIVIEGPLKKDTCSILLSARSTYSDWLLARIKDPVIRTSAANFYDFSGAVNYDIRKTQVALFVYHSKDQFRLSDINDYTYSNSGVSLTFNHNYTNSLNGEFALIGSQYNFSTTDKQEVSTAYEHSYKMGHYEARADFKHMLSNINTLIYGTGFILYKLDRGTVVPNGPQSLRSTISLGQEQGLESALYFSDSYDALPWLNITAGLRYTLFNPLGAKNVYTYTSGLPMDTRYINDTLHYGKNEPIRWYSEPDLRAAVNIETDENGSVKLAFNQMHQNLFMLNNTITIAPNAQWKLADYHLLPSRSNQFSLGVFRTLAQFGLESSVEVYYKYTMNFPEFKDGANFLESPLLETTVLQGTQKAYGLEFFLKRSNRKFEGWLSYTWSHSIVKVSGDHAWSQINNGEAYPSNYDIPHVLNLILSYHLTRRVTFSSIIAYQTGKPITYPESVYYINGAPYFDFSKRNAYRIPDYFRSDLSITIEGNLKRRKLLHSSFSLSVYNLTGRDNPNSVYFKTESGSIRSYQYSVIGVPILTATWIFKLGNYASE
jgi:hypothetical protein